MSVMSVGIAWIVAQAAMGCHGREVRPTSALARVEPSMIVTRCIVALQKSPRWRDRDRAAQELRHMDWRRHPEVVGALAFSLLHDPENEVREEAAESLTRMRPCLPEAHEALRLASADRDFATRKWARRGLAALAKRCEGPCIHCGEAVPATIVTEEIIMPGRVVVEPAEAPPPPPPGRPLAAPRLEPDFPAIPEDSIDSTVPVPSGLDPLPPPPEPEPFPGEARGANVPSGRNPLRLVIRRAPGR